MITRITRSTWRMPLPRVWETTAVLMNPAGETFGASLRRMWLKTRTYLNTLTRFRFHPPRLAMNFALLAGAESISKLFAFAAFTYLARVLGATRYGELEFTLALVFFFSIIVDCGQSTFSAREVAKDPVAAPRLAAHIIFTRLVLACGAFALLTLVAGLLNVLFPLKYFILLYGSTLFVSPLLLGWAFQGRELMKYVALASVLRWSMFGVGVFVLVRAPDQMWFIPLIEATALVCVAVF